MAETMAFYGPGIPVIKNGRKRQGPPAECRYCSEYRKIVDMRQAVGTFSV
jgi:hypothetical protein